MIENFDLVSHKNFGRKPGRGKYEYAIFKILFLHNYPVQVADFQRYIKFLFGGNHAPAGLKPRVIEALQKLKSRGIIEKIKREIIPKRIPRGRKLQRYAKKYPQAWKIIEENRQGENHKQGRYISLYNFRPGLPIHFLSEIKHETAEFFGFESWHDGLISPGRDFRDTLINSRNAYQSKTKAGLPRPVYVKEKASDINIRTGFQQEDVKAQGLLDSLLVPGSLCKRTQRLLRKFVLNPHVEAGPCGAETKTHRPLESRGIPGEETNPREEPA